PNQFSHQRLMVPGRLADELLQSLPLPIMQVGDRFAVLAVEVRKQALDILLGIGLLLWHLQRRHKRLQKRIEARHHAAQEIQTYLRILEQLTEPNSKSSFHRLSSSRQIPSAERSLYNKTLRSINAKTQ